MMSRPQLKLTNTVLEGKAREMALEEAAESLARGSNTIMIDDEAWITVEMIATGALSPCTGFMNAEDYSSVLHTGRLADGTPWPTPLSFAVAGERNQNVLKGLKKGDVATLINRNKEPVARIITEEVFEYDREERAQCVFGTTDKRHPGVRSIYERMGERSLAGKVELISRPHWGAFEKYRLTPAQCIDYFYNKKGARTVVGFITGANPVHRGHEHIHRTALENHDMLLIQPLVQLAKPEYIRSEYRIQAYEALLNKYYQRDRVLMSPLRVTYIFAGPREAVLHAIVARNFGATHFAIGRDHAGVGNYYGDYECQTIFDRLYEGGSKELGIELLSFSEVFYCARCGTTATENTCPHGKQYRIAISGTAIRELMRYGYMPPKEIVRPEVAAIAMQGIQPKGLDENGNSIYPVGSIVKKLFPFYLVAKRLGGKLREKPLSWESLTLEDVERALMDVRENSDRILGDIAREMELVFDARRDMAAQWINEASEYSRERQLQLIKALEEKVASADPNADNRMFQSKAEAERELEMAKYVYECMNSKGLDHKKMTWNPLKYSEYR
ncbi:ATP sulfurylase (sulfate adenylyltransferase) [Methanocella conradii HZ254]|uniref:ATP sulfurylase (Sulfate adenylyltransferase) n=1 Tax=Methanocella conradii (strain DSM 24694 / JCM 17849 / CGMCC 1.5162 / HZ254) TaxID=1041930 RepID=H8I809_METCZ|nr:sulfate adenylyltransferase [Methanocella conradii]AFD00409.1 ATP sulfurylase (sulfate adenylyltransferase) [Methanocella conradii HZ254]